MTNHFTDPEAHELADAINVVQDRVDAVITQHRVLAERVALNEQTMCHELDKLKGRVSALEAYYGDLEKSVARLEAIVIDELPGVTEVRTEPPDASWRD